MVIRKEDEFFKADQALNGEKKSMEGNWDIINKNGHSTFHSSKPGNFQ